MKNTSVKMTALAVATTLVLTGTGFGVKANETYDETNIGITSALDRYIAEQQAAAQSSEDAAATTTPAETDTVAQPQDTVSTAKYPQFEGKVLANVNEYVNVRREPDENAEKAGKLPKGAIATVLEQTGDWTKIESGQTIGYIKTEYLLFGDAAGEYAEANLTKIATVNTTTLKVREDQSADSACVTMIPIGEEYTVLNQYEEWTEIEVDESTTGFVSNEFIDFSFNVTKAISVEEEEAAAKAAEEAARAAAAAAASSSSSSSSSNSGSSSSSSSSVAASTAAPSSAAATGTRADIVNYALQFVGNPYVYGGSSLTNGTDCSGFTMSVYAHFGYSLCHSSSGQSGQGTRIDVSEVQPGDLLFYSNGSGINHVAMYIGNGQVVHASSPSSGIKISVYNYRTPCAAVRIVE